MEKYINMKKFFKKIGWMYFLGNEELIQANKK
jgi:hypothetical protein